MMLTTNVHLGPSLRVSGALPLIFLYVILVLTRTSPHSSQLYVLGLVVVFNVTDIRLLFCFIDGLLMDDALDIKHYTNVSLSLSIFFFF
jgi:hypothetical protein